MILVAMVVVMSGVVGACGGSMRGQTADSIHCETNDVVILDPHDEAGVETWHARCRGRTREYECVRGGDDVVACNPENNDGMSEVAE